MSDLEAFALGTLLAVQVALQVFALGATFTVPSSRIPNADDIPTAVQHEEQEAQ